MSGTGGGAPGTHQGFSRNYTTRDNVLSGLRRGSIDVVIQVNLLQEGFDLPLLSVAVLFHRPGSMGPFAQFVGRTVRRLTASSAGVEELR